jgi:RNA polymerase sigma-70 factor (ECF subfamily)
MRAESVVVRHGHDASDAEVLERVASGDLSALGALFDRHSDALRRLLGRLGTPTADIDDLLQLTFLDAMRAAQRYDGRFDARPWLSGLAVVTVRRHRRGLSRLWGRIREWAHMPRAELGDSPEEIYERQEDIERAQRALDALSQKKREVFVMVVLEGIPGEDAARALGIPVATVWTRLHHARLELRAAFRRREP